MWLLSLQAPCLSLALCLSPDNQVTDDHGPRGGLQRVARILQAAHKSAELLKLLDLGSGPPNRGGCRLRRGGRQLSLLGIRRGLDGRLFKKI